MEKLMTSLLLVGAAGARGPALVQAHDAERAGAVAGAGGEAAA